MTSGDEAGMRFKEKSVVVTGGASGIGRAVTEQFAQEGAAVALPTSIVNRLKIRLKPSLQGVDAPCPSMWA
ncbi:MAG: SDR family NAD(P)-dependent oxidoreductase [Gammaproteobacteria bacterium]|nr:SDR family NAD(P)-dependent oxidoreductase [Gammaproteobacteria bacterium]